MYSDFNLVGKALKFRATCMMCEEPVQVYGKIEFLKADEYVVYATWNISKSGQIIAGKAANFYSDIKKRTNDTVITQIINQIERHRFRRKYLFKDIRLLIEKPRDDVKENARSNKTFK
jgi:hypothetical protein